MHSLAEQWTAELSKRKRDDAVEYLWLDDLRRSGAAALEKYGLPNRKVEDWKYTSLKLLESRSQRLAVDRDNALELEAKAWPVPVLDGNDSTIRLLNGRPEPGMAAPGGIRVEALNRVLGGDNFPDWAREVLESLEIKGAARAFSALNTSTLGPGLLIHVLPGTDGGVLLLQWACDGSPPARLFNSRVLIRLEQGASLTLVHQFESTGAHAHGLNLVVQADIGKGATLREFQVQQEVEEAALIVHNECDVHGQGQYEFASFDWGGGLVRHDIRPRLLDAGASARVSGAFVLDNSRHVDYHILVDHAGGKTSSEQFFRGVLGGKSRGVFNGKARICQGADGSEVRQSNANLLLSSMAEIDTKPELEIYADEVEASHGATVGQLDEDAVFYLRSRGLSEEQARAMLTSAFCKAVLDRATGLPASLNNEISSRLECVLGELVGSRPRTAAAPLPG